MNVGMGRLPSPHQSVTCAVIPITTGERACRLATSCDDARVQSMPATHSHRGVSLCELVEAREQMHVEPRKKKWFPDAHVTRFLDPNKPGDN